MSTAKTTLIKDLVIQLAICIRTFQDVYRKAIANRNKHDYYSDSPTAIAIREAHTKLKVLVPLYRGLHAVAQQSIASEQMICSRGIAAYQKHYDCLLNYIRTELPYSYDKLNLLVSGLETLELLEPGRDTIDTWQIKTMPEIIESVRAKTLQKTVKAKNSKSDFLASLTGPQKELLKVAFADARKIKHSVISITALDVEKL